MNEKLYNKTIKCSVCQKNFEITKVKAKTSKVLKRESDFFVTYEGINPVLYDPIICEHCGYAAQADKFDTISPKDVETILKNISQRWKKRSFAGERTIDMAIDAYKLVLLNLHVRKVKKADLSKVLIRIAWMYRLKHDEREKEFLQYALDSYNETYEKEKLPYDKLDETTCMYMIAELSRRTGHIEDSIKWFSKLISSPQARQNATLLEMAREQFQLVKDEQKQVE